jgi:tetratricopeptide (TPR) repeat protein
MWAYWNIGRIYQEGASPDYRRAIATWDQLQKDLPKAGVLPKAIVKKGQAYLALGEVDNAKAAFLSLERLRGLPEGQKKIARYWIIFIKQHQGQAPNNRATIEEALNEYKALLKEVEGNEELKEVAILARLGIGECMIGLRQYAEALAFFEQIAKTANDAAVLAGAFNGLGRCHFEQQNWKEALLSFLRVVLLYDENPTQSAMALYFAGRSYHMLKGPDWKERARSLLRECIAKYGGDWARQAEEELQKIR